MACATDKPNPADRVVAEEPQLNRRVMVPEQDWKCQMPDVRLQLHETGAETSEHTGTEGLLLTGNKRAEGTIFERLLPARRQPQPKSLFT